MWLLDLDRPPVDPARLGAHLDDAERARAARFRFGVHRRRFIAGRGLLRELLGRFLGTAPAAIELAYGEKGKPRLAHGGAGGPAGGTDLRFNLSHSVNAAMLAVGRGRELGVDVEAVRPLEDASLLVERFFAPRERRVFSGLEEGERLAAFFTGWTRKEAYVKARGDGLSLPTTEFEVEIEPGSAARLLDFPREPEEVERWTLVALEPADGFLGALAVEGAGVEVVERRWPA